MWSATFRLIAAPSLPPFPSIFIIFPGHGMRFAAECPWAKGGERGEGENVGESNRERAKREEKKREGEFVYVRRVYFILGGKFMCNRIFLFKSIWKIFGEVLNLEIIIWSFFFLIIYNFSFHLSTKFRIVWWNVPHVLHQCVLIYVYIVFLFFFFMFVLMFEHCPLIELHRNDLKYIK